MRSLVVCLALVGCGDDMTALAPDGSADAPAQPMSDGSTDSGPALPTPIRYVVVIVKENHTFENYFTSFPGATTSMTARLHDGTTITRARAPDGMIAGDIPHGHGSAVQAWNNGAMNGFDTLLPADPRRPYMYYAESQIPNYWQYARNFALFDHFFATLGGPSDPGHFACATAQTPMYGNSSGGDCHSAPAGASMTAYNDSTCTTDYHAPCFDVPSVVDVLPPDITWRIYGHGSGTSVSTAFNFVRHIGGNNAVRAAHFRDFTQLQQDLASGDMANYSHVDVYGAPNGASEHPPNGPCPGENFTVDLVNRIMQGPHWNETAIIITWDDFGGWYDHVAPAVERCANGQWFNPGFRLPALVISPYAKRAVIRTVTEQASIPKLVEDLFGGTRLHDIDPNARDNKVGSMMGAFDFTQTPHPPLVLQPRTCP
jgi:phospholipase C